METNNKITDELIAKYICGNTNEEEESLIHEYLARNPEFADELLDVATALRQQQKKDDEAHKGINEQPKEAKRVLISSRRTFYVVAASVVLLIGIGFLVFRPFSDKDQGQSPVLVNTSETTKIDTTVNDTISNLEPVSNYSINQEVPILVENQESSVQSSENATNPIEQPFLADNSGSQPQKTNTSANSERPIEASLTKHIDNSAAPLKANAVFFTDIPAACNPDSALILKWSCNAPTLELYISYGEGKSWEQTYDQSVHQEKLSPKRLQGFKNYSPQGFSWRMTAYYRDGTCTKEGFIKFSN